MGVLIELKCVTQDTPSQEPVAGKGASLLLLKLVLFFSLKVLWLCEPPPCLCPAWDLQLQQQDTLPGQGQEEQPPPCTSGAAHLDRERWQRTPEVWAVSFCLRTGRGHCEQHKCRKRHWKKPNKSILPIACHYLALR